MVRSTSAHLQGIELSRLGCTALDAGDPIAARVHFLKAMEIDRREAGHRYNLAVTLEALGDYDGAAKQLTVGLKLDPKMSECARLLSLLLGRTVLSDKVELDIAGLETALGFPTIDKELIAQCALRYLLAREPLRTLMQKGAAEGWDAVARAQCLKATAPILRNTLFLSILRTSINTHPQLEHLLTALRRVIALELPQTRYAGAALVSFIAALAHQCHANEFVWPLTSLEQRALDEWTLSTARAPEDSSVSKAIMLCGLYRPFHEVVDVPTIKTLFGGSAQPGCKTLVELMTAVVTQHQDELVRAKRLRSQTANADPTSRMVAEQYEANPYPRWTSLGMRVRSQDIRKVLNLYFPDAKLKFMDSTFDVLIAGCGTGRQAIASAMTYGNNARVVALDLSIASLSYASRMAEQLGVTNIEFKHGDILDIARSGEMQSRFKIIECCGVLHHMADPWEGWRSLLKGLDRNGLMFIALYSARARADLAALRNDPRYPGPGCDDNALRSYRRDLLVRPAFQSDHALIGSRDFYTTSGFRDLTLHVSEKCATLPEISRFMIDNSLVFRGFNDRGHFSALCGKFPEQSWPGDMQRWVEFEECNPLAFAGMYQFWCDLA